MLDIAKYKFMNYSTSKCMYKIYCLNRILFFLFHTFFLFMYGTIYNTMWGKEENSKIRLEFINTTHKKKASENQGEESKMRWKEIHMKIFIKNDTTVHGKKMTIYVCLVGKTNDDRCMHESIVQFKCLFTKSIYRGRTSFLLTRRGNEQWRTIGHAPYWRAPTV